MKRRKLFLVVPLLLVPGCFNFVNFFLDAEFEVAPKRNMLSVVTQGVNAISADKYNLDNLVGMVMRRFEFEPAPETVWLIRNKDHYWYAMTKIRWSYGLSWDDDLSSVTDEEAIRMFEEWDALGDLYGNEPDSRHFGYRLPAQGIGVREPRWPVPGPPTLKGAFFVPDSTSLFERAIHEQFHNWVAYPPPTGVPHLAQTIRESGNHWGFSEGGGPIGGWVPGSLVYIGDGVYLANCAPWGRILPTPASDLELYLMGLKPLETGISVAVNPRNVEFVEIEEDYPGLDENKGVRRFEADGIVTYTAEEIISAYGPRDPPVGVDTEHNILVVIISDHHLSDEEWDWYDRGMSFLTGTGQVEDHFPPEEFGPLYDYFTESAKLNWSQATRGYGTLKCVKVR